MCGKKCQHKHKAEWPNYTTPLYIFAGIKITKVCDFGLAHVKHIKQQKMS